MNCVTEGKFEGLVIEYASWGEVWEVFRAYETRRYPTLKWAIIDRIRELRRSFGRRRKVTRIRENRRLDAPLFAKS